MGSEARHRATLAIALAQWGRPGSASKRTESLPDNYEWISNYPLDVYNSKLRQKSNILFYGPQKSRLLDPSYVFRALGAKGYHSLRSIGVVSFRHRSLSHPNRIDTNLSTYNWENMLRVVGSLKLGTVDITELRRVLTQFNKGKSLLRAQRGGPPTPAGRARGAPEYAGVSGQCHHPIC